MGETDKIEKLLRLFYNRKKSQKTTVNGEIYVTSVFDEVNLDLLREKY